jgi:regulatory protein
MSDIDPELFENSPSSQDTEEINPADIRFSAMNFLARREHTLRELQQKLKGRYADEGLIAIELERLADENLQSDARFAESFVRERANRGHGLIKVQHEMRERGLSDSDIGFALESAGIDWFAVAKEVYIKKFGEAASADMKEKAKRVRFMQYRGFDASHYRHIMD